MCVGVGWGGGKLHLAGGWGPGGGLHTGACIMQAPTHLSVSWMAALLRAGAPAWRLVPAEPGGPAAPSGQIHASASRWNVAGAGSPRGGAGSATHAHATKTSRAPPPGRT